MKRKGIKLKKKCIVLGVFHTKTMNYFKYDRKVMSYGGFSEEYDEESLGVIQIVELACQDAKQIIFVLDEITFPINPLKSITCKELELVCKDYTLFNKTVFVKGDNVIEFDKNLVLN